MTCSPDKQMVALSPEEAQLLKAAPALKKAAKSAASWLDRFGEHAPIAFGGEAELSEELQAAINLSE